MGGASVGECRCVGGGCKRMCVKVCGWGWGSCVGVCICEGGGVHVCMGHCGC